MGFAWHCWQGRYSKDGHGDMLVNLLDVKVTHANHGHGQKNTCHIFS
jgi:hypothetical protein